jgi:hypothetical protein
VLLASGVVLLLLIVAYVRRFALVFQSSDLYAVHAKVLSWVGRHGVSVFKPDPAIKDLAVENLKPTQIEQYKTGLVSSIFLNRACLFWSKRMRDYQKSGIVSATHVLVILFLIASTVLGFAAINWGVFRYDPTQFSVQQTPTFFSFFYYSFNNLIFNGVPDVLASGVFAKIVYMVQTFSVFILVAILISVFLTHSGQRESEHLDTAIDALEKESARIELSIRSEYRFSNIDEALAELRRLKSGAAEFLIKMSASLR